MMADKRAQSARDSGNFPCKKKHKSGSQKRREQEAKLLFESAKNLRPLTSFFKANEPTVSTGNLYDNMTEACLGMRLATYLFVSQLLYIG